LSRPHDFSQLQRVVLTLVSLFATTACGGSGAVGTQPNATIPVGHFDLIEYDGAALPVTLRVIISQSVIPGDNRSSTCPENLTASAIDVTSDGIIMRTAHLSYPCTGTLPRPADLPDSTTLSESGHASVSGDSLTFSYVSGNRQSTEYARPSGNNLVFYFMQSGTGGQLTISTIHRVYRRS
jgi:hypothetical protein